MAGLQVLLLAGCATFAVQTHGWEEDLAKANTFLTTIVQSTDSGLQKKTVTLEQAEAVSQMAHTAIPFLDAAKAAPDAGERERNAQLASAVLTALQSYVDKEAVE